jgi:quercetin dioxygenase-like cupin family protein
LDICGAEMFPVIANFTTSSMPVSLLILAASNVYKLLMENGMVRVLKVVSKPGNVAKMHYHPDHVVYAVKGGKVALTSGGKTQEIELKADSAMFLDAQSHEMKNVGKTTIELIVTELKK